MKNQFKQFGKNGPLIVIENGLGNSMYPWYQVIEDLSDKARIFVYHRKGYGNSVNYDTERTLSNISCELYDLLESQELLEPFILVGHSFGGLIAQFFTLKYPQLVKALILVDSSSRYFEHLESVDTPVLNNMFSIENLTKEWLEIYNMESTKFSEKTQSFDCYDERLPESWNHDMKLFLSNQQIYKTISDEMSSFKLSSIELSNLLSISKFSNIDVSIITRDAKTSIENFISAGIPDYEADIYETIWKELQEEIMSHFNNAKYIIAEGSDHSIMVDRPGSIIMAIMEILKNMKSSS